MAAWSRAVVLGVCLLVACGGNSAPREREEDGVARVRSALGAEVSPGMLDFGEVRVGTRTSRLLTLRNTGSATRTLTSVSLSSAAFELVSSPSMPTALSPGDSVSVTVSFLPTTEGVVSTGTLSFTTDDPDSANLSVPLSGKGVRPHLVVESTTVDFGTQGVNTVQVRLLKVRNDGSASVRVDSLTLTGSPAFTVPYSPFSLAPGDSRDLPVSFSPTAEGSVTASLRLQTDDPENSPRVALFGNAVRPLLALSTSPLNFGDVEVGRSSEYFLALRNVGTGTLTVTALSLSNASLYSFTASPVHSFPFSIREGESEFVRVEFTPRGEGATSGSLSIFSNDVRGAQTLALAGRGVVATIAVSTPALSFGLQRVGSRTSATVTVKNVGSSLLRVLLPSLTGSGFALDSFEPFDLLPGEEHVLVITFLPTRGGEARGSLVLRSNDSANAVQTVGLSGSGVDSVLGVDVTALDFGAQRVGMPITRTVTVSNPGTSAVRLTPLATAPFTVTPSAPIELAPGTNQSLTVTFTPAAEGPFSATLKLVPEGLRSFEESVVLSGKGVVSSFVVGPTTLDFGPQRVGTASGVQRMAVHNIGPTPLRILSLSLSDGAPFQATLAAPLPLELAPGTSRELSVTFQPTSERDFASTLTLTTDADRMPVVTLGLSGTGTGEGNLATSEEPPRGCATTGGVPVGAGLLVLLSLLRARPRRERMYHRAGALLRG